MICGSASAWNGYIGNKDSLDCANANTALQQNAYYLFWNPERNGKDNVSVTSALTNSVKIRLWGNTALKG